MLDQICFLRNIFGFVEPNVCTVLVCLVHHPSSSPDDNTRSSSKAAAAAAAAAAHCCGDANLAAATVLGSASPATAAGLSTSPLSNVLYLWLEFVSREGGRRRGLTLSSRWRCTRTHKRQRHVCGAEQPAQQPPPLQRLCLQVTVERPLVGLHSPARRLLGRTLHFRRIQLRRAHRHPHRDHQS